MSEIKVRAMARSPQDITDKELEVMQFLWEQGPATIRQLTAILYPEGGVAHYATVQKLLERLEGKACVTRQRSGPVHIYSAALVRDELIGRRLQAMAEKLCGGSLTPLLTHLVQAQRLSSAERQELRSLIDDLDQHDQSKKRPR
jgi:BlaI family penicillinase repressor